MNRLKELRQERKLSLRKLAARAQVDQSTISEIENNKRKAQKITLEKLAEALAAPVTEFNDLLDTSASQRGSTGQQARQDSRNQSQAVRQPSNNVKRTAQPPQADCWLFEVDPETPALGPFSQPQAEAVQARLQSLGVKCRIFRGQDFSSVFEEYRRLMVSIYRGSAFWQEGPHHSPIE